MKELCRIIGHRNETSNTGRGKACSFLCLHSEKALLGEEILGIQNFQVEQVEHANIPNINTMPMRSASQTDFSRHGKPQR